MVCFGNGFEKVRFLLRAKMNLVSIVSSLPGEDNDSFSIRQIKAFNNQLAGQYGSSSDLHA